MHSRFPARFAALSICLALSPLALAAGAESHNTAAPVVDAAPATPPASRPADSPAPDSKIERTTRAVEGAVEKTGEVVKEVVEKTKAGAKTVARKTGKAVREVGEKIEGAGTSK